MREICEGNSPSIECKRVAGRSHAHAAPGKSLQSLTWLRSFAGSVVIILITVVNHRTLAQSPDPIGCSAFGITTREASSLPLFSTSASDPLSPASLESASPTSVGISSASSASTDHDPPLAKPTLSWETGAGKSFAIPALEIPSFIVLLNGFDRLTHGDDVENGEKVYSTTLSTFRDHLIHGPWGFDQDSFKMNQFMHPYTGSIYYGLARSAGLNYWQSLGYTFAGSFLWETAGETTPPSINDQVATGIGGSLLGETLFRMAQRLLETEESRHRFWSHLGGALIAPSAAFNRLAYGERFDPIFPSHDPATFQRLRVGASLNAHINDRSGLNTLTRYLATADYALSYGLPGKPGYVHERPFDYFDFEFAVVNKSRNAFEDLTTRGLLAGKDYAVGDAYRGVWGLYGSFDYIAPHIFRVSSTAASLGTTYQWWLTRLIALQGSALAGIGYGAAGNTEGLGERDYHYGATSQGLLAFRLILSDIAAIETTGREYFVSGFGATETDGSERIARATTALSFRVYHRHAIGVQYLVTRRNAHYGDRPRSHQSLGTFTLVYTLLGDRNFGAVEWRDLEAPVTQ